MRGKSSRPRMVCYFLWKIAFCKGNQSHMASERRFHARRLHYMRWGQAEKLVYSRCARRLKRAQRKARRAPSVCVLDTSPSVRKRCLEVCARVRLRAVDLPGAHSYPREAQRVVRGARARSLSARRWAAAPATSHHGADGTPPYSRPIVSALPCRKRTRRSVLAHSQFRKNWCA